MKKFKHFFIAKGLAVVLSACMIAGTVNMSALTPVRAEETSAENGEDSVPKGVGTELINEENTDIGQGSVNPTENESVGGTESNQDGNTSEKPNKKPDEETTENKKDETEDKSDTEVSELIELSTVVNDVEITLKGSADAFPKDGVLSLQAEEITDTRLEQAKEKLEKDMLTDGREFVAYRLFDVTPLADGEEVQPNEKVSVSFRNLTLQRENGVKTDVVPALEEDMEVSDAPALMKESGNDTEETETNISVYHFVDEENIEEVTPTVENDEMVVEVNHFSWFFAGEDAKSGEPYTWNYEKEGGEYTLDYILRHYNVFISGDYTGTHVVGPMVVGGKTSLHGSLGGTTQGTGDYVHTAPSYLEGEAFNESNPTNFPEIITARSGLPIYVGQDNKMQNVRYNPHYFTPEKATDKQKYVNFSEVFPEKLGEPSGTLYGNKEDEGSIAYYQAFHGYDANGKKVDSIEITDEIIQKAIEDTLDWTDPTEGVMRYYDKNGDLVAGEDETVSKDEYVFAIDTLNNTVQKVNVRLRPGYNYTFDSFEQVNNIVYDYKTAAEMSNTLTIIQTLQTSDAIVLPRIYKSVQNDEFGKDYMFSSIEKGPNFSVLWFAPNVKKVVVGFKTTAANPGDTNGSKLVGHLVVPQADVVLGGGDYNGGVIARDVDAATVGSEGHMWPFVLGAYTPGIDIFGQKTVDAQTPQENDKFQFEALLEKKNKETNEYEEVADKNEEDSSEGFKNPWVQTNDASGQFTFHYEYEDGELEPGDYRIRIKELPLVGNQTYVYDPTVYVGKFTIESVASDEESKPVNIKWTKYKNEKDAKTEQNGEETDASLLRYDNTTKRKLNVKKVWQDVDRNPIEDTSELPEISVKLYRDATPPVDGNRVVLNIYSSVSPDGVSQASRVSTRVLGYVRNGENVNFSVDCTDITPVTGWQNQAQAGVTAVTVQRGNDKQNLSPDKFGKSVYGCPDLQSGATGKVLNVESNVTIDVYYRTFEDTNNPDGGGYSSEDHEPTEGMFSIQTTGTNWATPDFEPLEQHLYETVTLNNENGWEYTWDDLAPRDINGNPYFYKVIEAFDGMGSYEVSYDNNNIRLHRSADGETITITNRKVPTVDLGLLKQDADKEGVNLAGAEFKLQKQSEDGKTSEKLWFVPKGDTPGEYMLAGKDSPDATDTLITGQDGFWKIYGISKGTYILQETKAPNGYQKEPRKATIRIEENSSTYQFEGEENSTALAEDDMGLLYVVFENTSSVELPFAGGSGINKFIIGGILIMGIGVLMFVYESIKRRKGA